jgi:hypothetical protein
MTPIVDRDLFARGAATLVASWGEYARGSSGAALLRLSGVAAAVFPDGPERAFYNNALLDRNLGAAERAMAVDAMETAYSAAADRAVRRLGPRKRRGDAQRAGRPRIHAQ